MQHFKLKRNGDYTYSSVAIGPATEVTVFYSKGGLNYFNGNQNPRGIYVLIQPVEYKPDGCKSFVIGSGIKTFVRPLQRKNDKTLLEIAEILDGNVPELTAMEPRQAIYRVREHLTLKLEVCS